MANKYFNWPGSLRRFVRFDAARSEDVNDALDEVSTAMDGVEVDTKRSIKLPASGADQLVNMTPELRANLVLGFDPTGAVTAVPGGGRFAGDWITGTAYLVSETFRDPVTKNLYSTALAHTSTTIADDLTASKIRLAVNVVDVELAKDAAAVSAGVAAQQAELATTNGAAQVLLAAQQAELATTNGAAQALLAAQQAELATTNGAAQALLAAQQAELATTNGAAQALLAAQQAELATTNGAAQVLLAAQQAELATTNGAAQALLAAQQAELATTNGAAQVLLAAQQAELATTNGAAQALLAAQQAELATTNGAAQVLLAAQQATLATSQADAARAIANFAGVWSTLTGSLNKPATVHHAGLFYVLVNSLANVALSEPGVTADWIAAGGGMPSYTYEQRGDLRASGGQFAVVDGLGLFQHVTASTEPDDDESCFATATGRWLLQAAHWDLIDAWQLPEVEERDAYDEDEPLRFAASFAAASKVLTGSATCAITSVAAVASTSFTGTVTGAAVGDRVIATPPAQLGATATETGQMGYHAWVSAANTVTVMLTNASASSANTNTAIRTAWPITVIKS